MEQEAGWRIAILEFPGQVACLLGNPLANFLLSHLRQDAKNADPRVAQWREAVINEMGPDRASISALVLDEVVYRSVVTWLRELGDKDPVGTYRRSTRQSMERTRSNLRTLWGAIDALDLEILQTNAAVSARARQLMDQAALGSRDAFHAAHAIENGCDWIVSADPDFDGLTSIRRLAPAVGG